MNSEELKQYKKRLTELIKPKYRAAGSYDNLSTEITLAIGEQSFSSQTLSNWVKGEITRGLSDLSLEKLGLYLGLSTDRAEARGLLRARLEGRDPAAKSLSLQSLQEQFEALAKRVAVLEAAIAQPGTTNKSAIALLIDEWQAQATDEKKEAEFTVYGLSPDVLEEIKLGRAVTVKEAKGLRSMLERDISPLVTIIESKGSEKQKRVEKLAIARRSQIVVDS